MDLIKNDVLANSLIKTENPNSLHNCENILFMDSPEDSKLENLKSETDIPNHLSNIHNPSPMVTRSCFSESICEPWKNVSIYSYSRNSTNGEAENTNAFNHSNKYGVYNVIGDNKSSISLNWINCQQTQNCSPELLRRTDVIFEENIQTDNNGDLDNSDYSDRSQSPINSVSSDDSTERSSNSSVSASGSPEDEECPSSPNGSQLEDTSSTEQSDSFHPSQQESRFLDFNCRFLSDNNNGNGDIDGGGDEDHCWKRYHQPPKAIDREAAKRLARRLYDCDGFKITDVAKHLSKRNDFSQIVGEEFANFFEFSTLRLDAALRLFLGKFALTGDTQERERIMHHFSRRYVVCNEDVYNGEDACHTLVCALIILNTNLHSQTFPKMSSADFINNLKDLNDGDNFPAANLEELFSAIEKEPIRWPLDDELVGIVNMNKSDIMDLSKQLINTAYKIGFDEPRDSNCRDFMSGYVVRKWLKEPGGRKTAFGKRGWKLYYGRLRDLTIYLYKDHDKSCSQPKAEPKTQNSVKKVKVKSSKRAKKQVPSTGSERADGPRPADSTETDSTELDRFRDANGAEPDRQPHSDPISQCAPPHTGDKKLKDPSPSSEKPAAPSTTVIKTPSPDPCEPVPPCPPQHSLILPPADSEIHIHHAFASRATDYVKKKNVFRIKTKYGSEYLFQVNNEKEMESWIDNINYVAALLSDPEPIIGISTMEKLSARSIPRPKITTFNVRNQLESHQKCVLELEKIITNLRENPPKKSERKNQLEYEESIRFREEELLRYKIYSQLLEFEITKMQNLTSMRCLSSGEMPFFCQQQQQASSTATSFSLPMLLPSTASAGGGGGGLLAMNGGASPLDPTGYLVASSCSSGGSNGPAVSSFSQPPGHLRFRPPPVLHNLVPLGGGSSTRRLRYRSPVVTGAPTSCPTVTGPTSPVVATATTTMVTGALLDRDTSPTSPSSAVAMTMMGMGAITTTTTTMTGPGGVVVLPATVAAAIATSSTTTSTFYEIV